MPKVFITGVAGFLGSHLADAMIDEGMHVRGIDNLIGGYEANIPAGVAYDIRDCNRPDLYKDMLYGVDVVYHCAATAYEGLSVFSPHIVTQNIVGASVGVFSAAIAAGVKRIVHCSSMARYGTQHPPFSESMACYPQDPYGIGKLCAERMLANLCETHGVEYVIAVPHNIIGPRQKYDDPFRNVASIMINLMLQGRQPIIYGDGTQQRCFSFVQDCLQCLVQMAFTSSKEVLGQVINIGPDEETVTINDLAARIARLLNWPLAPIYMPGRPQEVKVALCSSDKARHLLNYKTTTSLDDGLQAMIDAIKRTGPKPFVYHLPIEIASDKTPKTWTDRLF
jgi:UDP-glucose 4-epimerase